MLQSDYLKSLVKIFILNRGKWERLEFDTVHELNRQKKSESSLYMLYIVKTEPGSVLLSLDLSGPKNLKRNVKLHVINGKSLT
jgi:hypothetical protein